VENIDETNLPLLFVKPFGMTSGASVRGMVGLILVRNIFSCFNFYSIEKNFTKKGFGKIIKPLGKLFP